MTPRLPKRFYAAASVGERDGQFVILLDGKPAKTRGGNTLAAPAKALVATIAEEWNAQGEFINIATMPLTRLAMTAIDHGDSDADKWRGIVITFLKSDLVCYRAAEPAALVRRQREAWDPLREWASVTLGVKLETAEGIAFVDQGADALAACGKALTNAGPFELLGIKTAAEIAGSAIIALALAAEAFSPELLFTASRVDEEFQAGRWGRDAEAEARTARLKDEFMTVARFLDLCRAG